MCELSTIASLALGLAKTGASLASQNAAARETARQNAERAALLRQQAIADYDRLQRERDAARDDAVDELNENRIDAVKAREKARVSAGEAGVSGLSVDALLRDLYGREARHVSATEARDRRLSIDLRHKMKDAERGTTAKLQALPTPKRPDYLGAGVRAGLQIVGALDRASRGR